MIRSLLVGLLLTLPVYALSGDPHVLLHTQLGDIELELDLSQAPVSTRNFLNYVKGGFYDGGIFHRTVTKQNQPDKLVKIEVIHPRVSGARTDGPDDNPLPHIDQSGLHVLTGCLS
jgi:peptidyl-prolyl cis-trans isomerase A (cyclophilin A)